MFLFNFLIAIFIGKFLTPLHGFHGFLCKFRDIHMQASSSMLVLCMLCL